jgi:ABC-type transport system involved in multi-copper enzyme maturation permease subunit
MNMGLVRRALRELRGVTLGLGLALFLFEGVLAYVMPTFSQRFAAQMAQMEFMQSIVKAMLGIDSPMRLGKEMFWAIPLAHPVVLALTWAHAIIACTRVPAGEVDRGTIDVLMGLPVSRLQIFISESAAWLASAVLLIALAGAGNLLGRSQLAPDLRADPVRIAEVLPLLLCLYLSVGGMAWLVSSLSDRRGRAVSMAFLIVLVSFLLNYLAQFWEPAKHVAFLSVLKYYLPYQILHDGVFPWRDAATLLGTGAAMWGLAGAIFARRDLAAL